MPGKSTPVLIVLSAALAVDLCVCCLYFIFFHHHFDEVYVIELFRVLADRFITMLCNIIDNSLH